MDENELLTGFKAGKYSTEEVLAFYAQRQATTRQPLSEGQKGLWLLQKLDPTSDVYNVPIAFRVRTTVDLPALRTAVEYVIAQHEALSSVIVEDEGVPHLVAGGADVERFRHQDATGLDEAEWMALLRAEAKAPFDLTRSLARATVYSLGGDHIVVLLLFHHIVFDGASVPIVLRDLWTSYEALRAGRSPRALPGAGKYRQFVAWEQQQLAGPEGAAHRDFWMRTLAGSLPVLELDGERKSAASAPALGATCKRTLSREVTARLRQACAVDGVSPALFLLAAYQRLLYQNTGVRDLVVGMPSMGRPSAELADAVGYFVNMMPLRYGLDGDKSFSTHLAELRLALADGIDHAAYPFPRIVQDLAIPSSRKVPPIFQVSYTFQNRRMMHGAAEDVSAGLRQSIAFIDEIAQEGEFKLALEIFENVDDLLLHLKYDANRFHAGDVQRLLDQYEALLNGLMEQPGLPPARHSPLSAEERHRVVVEWNDTEHPYAHDRCLHELFEAMVERHGERPALLFRDQRLTYSELNERANQVAHALRAHGVTADTPVGLCVERSFEMVIGILGIAKAGGAYVPIEPAYPAERIRYMLDSAGAQLVLSQSQFVVEGLAGRTVIALDGDASEDVLRPQPRTNLDRQVTALDPTNLAYVIFTSGSTGRPKGVMVEHRAAVNRIEWMQNEYPLQPDDVVLQKTPFSFDVSVWEFFWPLIAGAKLVIAEPGGHKDTSYLTSIIRQHGVTTLHFVPPMLRLIVEAQDWATCTSIRRIFCSGEALPADLPARHYAKNPAPIHNLYGPTEAAIDVSNWPCPPGALETVPIGKPIQNIQLYVLNEYDQLQPIGCAGQLHIAGDGLARGYINDGELTRQKFVPNPFSAKPGERMYRTGDRARWLPDGNIEFLGRIDDQVKIRGFRIELGEIEHQLAQHPKVRASVVLAREDQPGQRQLVAYVVLDSDEAANEMQGEWSRFLAKALPDYMIPTAFVHLERLPVNANGKIDRKALPAPGIDAYALRAHVAPRNPTEKILVEACAELLGFAVERIGVHDNFFALGGHSLLIPKLAARIAAKGLRCDISTVFDSDSLAALALLIDGASARDEYSIPVNRIPAGCERLTPEMLPLVSLRGEELAHLVGVVAGGAANVQDVYPLAALQEGMLFHHLKERENDPYILTALFSFASRAQLDAFVRGLQAAIDRHDVLRSAIFASGLSQPVQVVQRRAELQVEELEAMGVDAAELRARLAKPQVMELTRAPLFRLRAAANGETGEWLLGFNMHHVIDDATSLALLLNEIVAHLDGRADRLLPSAPYRDFVAHALHRLRSDDPRAFFEKYLGDVTEPTIAFDLQDVHGDGRAVLELRRPIEAQLGRRIRAAASELQVSPASLFHAAWALVVAAASGREDVVFGSVLSGRLQGPAGVERMLGNFINTLPVRVRLGEKSVKECVLETDKTLRELIRYEQAPLSLAQRCSGVASDLPLFNTILNYRHLERKERVDEAELARFGMQSLVGVIERSNYPISVSIDDLGDQFSIDVLVDEVQDAELLIGYLQTAVSGVVDTLQSAAARPALELDVLPPAVRQRLLREWNAPVSSFATDSCVHEWFERTAARTPGAVALTYGDKRLSYGELNKAANRLAHHLRRLGVGPDSRVALCVPRSERLVVGILAILKAGGGYVPLDPAYPGERLRYMLEDSAPVVLLKDGPLPAELGDLAIPTLDLSADDAKWLGEASENPSSVAIGLRPEHLAYIIYTSGSTGAPKGVMIEHQQLTRLFTATEAWFHLGSEDVWTLFHSFAFDFSVWEMWGALLYGGRLVVVPQATTRNPKEVYELLCAEGVTVLNQTPSAFRQLMAAQADRPQAHALRLVIFGGEALEVATLAPWMQREANRATQLVNMYGITETTVHVTYCPLTAGDAAATTSPIGRPIPDLRIYLLDARRRPVPIGAVGEIWVGGGGVARGYLNRPELTAERFLRDPFADEPGARMYRSGDLGRYAKDGRIEYLGRNDLQVKIRGFRIELGEIEARLSEHAAVEDVRVIARDYGEQDKRLVAYVVPSPERAFPVRQLLRMRKATPDALANTYELPNGLVLFHQNKSETEFLYKEIFTDNEYLKHGIEVRDGDCIFDVGANIGAFTVFIGQHFRNATIHAFEPIPPLCDTVRANVALYGLNAQVHQCGLAAEAKSEQFTFYRHNTVISSSLTTAEQARQTVKAFLRNQQQLDGDGANVSDALLDELVETRLDTEQFTCALKTLSQTIAENAIERIDLLKVDVENAEHEVLKGIAAGDWPKIRQLVVEVHDVDGRLDAIVALLEARGFAVHRQQDEKLMRNTPLHILYARRPGETQGAAPAATTASRTAAEWVSERALVQALETAIRRRLPDYMMPAGYVLLDELPLTQNGKLDQRALPAGDGSLLQEEKVVAPRSELEKQLAQLWAELLQLDVTKLGVGSNFFQLGGNSLLVTRLINRITLRTAVELPIQCVFDGPTIAQLAAEVAQRLPEMPDALAQNVDTILSNIALVEAMSEEELGALLS